MQSKNTPLRDYYLLMVESMPIYAVALKICSISPTQLSRLLARIQQSANPEKTTEIFDWLSRFTTACAGVHKVRSLQPEEKWEAYNHMGTDKSMQEVVLLMQYRKKVRELWRDRPKKEAFVKQNVKKSVAASSP